MVDIYQTCRCLTWSSLNLRIDIGNVGTKSSMLKDVFPPISGHSMVEWGNKLLVIAGHTKEKWEDVIVWSIDLETLFVSVVKTHGNIPVARGGQSISLVGSKLLMFGGEGKQKQLLNDLHILDLTTMAWDAIKTKNTSPSARFDHIATVHAGQYLFIFGGSTHATCLCDLHVLDLQTMEWSQPDVQGVAVTARGGHAGAVVDDLWYVVGGGNTESGATETIVLNMSKLVWSIATSVPTQDPISSEGQGLCSVSIGGESFLIAFGGYNGKYNNELFILKPKPRVPKQPKLYQSPAAAAAAASVSAAYAIATSTERNRTPGGVTLAELASLAAETLIAEKKDLESMVVQLRAENAKVKANLEAAASRQRLLAMELNSIGSQLQAERSRCFKLEVEISEIRERLNAVSSLERELEILRQQKSQIEQAMAEQQKQSSGSFLRWMTG
ncbi:hypothetical protein HPP92_020824 [Vanilla planifolia]|uniref:Acyl-CoA-binding domain-containing protein n=1 Tax=Vanilla planifolia TaxID=51239 RepID=A0A835Q312_VANPL|nr:hypothetical protein HPP92_020824 [Vanilla planifolia]